ncbi:hypothetical protein DA096_08780 [Vibrio rotiferianus]|uniref:hypothetical protein n=1 Tax=Vibrio rotiferianus TaxID=190895 RepID=UPI001110F2CC|nr:hypothetical protein [Vibrio rotiferianus]TMX33851.1 hypothetical protein DA095_16360 [Vibrio rotiferianus]TMX55304.1 hypothetical protein DA093_08105 [Vibrio rotiferianus]TMX66271.1 hypothetical protein DA096_08780 [Vibrio rotiferianus]
MFEWILDAFSTSSGKSQFISIVVSSCIAITVLLLNQRFNNQRERKKLHAEKIEELYITVIEYLDASDDLITDIQKGTYRKDSGYHGYNELTYAKREATLGKIEMLFALYFPEIPFSKADYDIDILPVFWASVSGKIARGEVLGDEVLAESRENLKNASKALKSMCKQLMYKRSI